MEISKGKFQMMLSENGLATGKSCVSSPKTRFGKNALSENVDNYVFYKSFDDCSSSPNRLFEISKTTHHGSNLQCTSNDSSNIQLITAAGSSTAQGNSASTDKRITLYKTEMCRTFEEMGFCRYGTKCQFAHDSAELRMVPRHPRYKTEICKTFWQKGYCPYGKRCCFIHAECEVKPNPSQIITNKLQYILANTNDERAGGEINGSTKSISSKYIDSEFIPLMRDRKIYSQSQRPIIQNNFELFSSSLDALIEPKFLDLQETFSSSYIPRSEMPKFPTVHAVHRPRLKEFSPFDPASYIFDTSSPSSSEAEEISKKFHGEVFIEHLQMDMLRLID